MFNQMFSKAYYAVSRFIKTYEIRNKYYSNEYPFATNKKKQIICMIDGRCSHGGIADRLKGITSLYYFAKQMDLDFKIHFVHPFSIDRIYKPNKYNWKIAEDEVSYNKHCSRAYYINSLIKVSQQFEENTIKKILNKNYKQIHIYSNSPLSHKYGVFRELYNELFDVYDLFTHELKPYLSTLNSENGYLCVVARFAGALGDFNDICPVKLSTVEQESLLENAVEEVKKLHKTNPGLKIFIATDSIRFMNATSELNYTVSVNQKKVNIDRHETLDFEMLKHSIIDFLLVSEADKIIQIQGDGMYLGAFGRSASYLHNRPYEIIKF